VIFTKGVASEVVAGSELQVKFNDKILNEDAIAKADLVVLATAWWRTPAWTSMR